MRSDERGKTPNNSLHRTHPAPSQVMPVAIGQQSTGGRISENQLTCFVLGLLATVMPCFGAVCGGELQRLPAHKGTMAHKTIALNWKGPFPWPGCSPESFLQCPEADLYGLYAWGINTNLDKYLLCGFGITRGSFASRIGYHNRGYRNGKYAIYDHRVVSGIRRNHWRGLWWEKEAWELGKPEFESKRSILTPRIEKLLHSFHIFVAPVTRSPRILERIESAIYAILRNDPKGAGIVIDEGWTVSYRSNRERPFTVQLPKRPRFIGLPRSFEA